MPLVTINQPQKIQREYGSLEKIALGLDIAAKTLGVAFSVPEFLQKRSLAKQQLSESEQRAKQEADLYPLKKQALQSDVETGGLIKGLTIKNLSGDISEQERLRTPLTENDRAIALSFLQSNGVNATIEDIPNTVGDWDKLRTSVLGRTVVTPAQQESLNISKEGLALRKSEAAKAEEERKLKREESTSAKFLAGGFGARMLESEKNFMDLSKSGFNRADKATSAESILPNLMQSSELQRQTQAERNFVNATLRRESGAAISPSEFESAEKQYFPRAGDAPEVLKQKRENRLQAIRTMLSEAGPDVRKQVLKKDMSSFYDELIHGNETQDEIRIINGKKVKKVPGGWDYVK